MLRAAWDLDRFFGKKQAMERGQDNIKMDVREREWEDADWMHLIQDRDQWWDVVSTVMKLGVP
jgi:hypothetical protein